MKVTRIETLRASRFIYVRVHTDEGISGVGELHPASGTSGTPFAPIAAVDYCAEYLIGEDPLHIERNWQHMFRRCVFRGGADTMAAIGAIDIALWDIKGKVAELPVHSLLGGPTRERVRVYSHLHGDSPAELAEDARRMVEDGYTALRLYPFGAFGAGGGTSLEQLSFCGMAKHAAATLQAVRDAVGAEVDLMVDVVNRLTPPEAIEVAKALEPYGLFFFEDPIEPENMDAWGYAAANMPVPVAMGERLYTIYQFRELLAHKGASYIRPDLSLAGGITNCKKIAALAEASYVGVAPHNPLSCVLTAACVQLDAAIHNVAIQEYPRDEYDAPKRDLVEMPLRREGGFLIVPQTPGIGIELNDEAFPHYPPEPYTREPVIGPDGALRDY